METTGWVHSELKRTRGQVEEARLRLGGFDANSSHNQMNGTLIPKP